MAVLITYIIQTLSTALSLFCPYDYSFIYTAFFHALLHKTFLGLRNDELHLENTSASFNTSFDMIQNLTPRYFYEWILI